MVGKRITRRIEEDMIPIQELIQSLNADLNAINPEVQFMIFADGDKYKKPTRDGNKIISYIGL